MKVAVSAVALLMCALMIYPAAARPMLGVQPVAATRAGQKHVGDGQIVEVARRQRYYGHAWRRHDLHRYGWDRAVRGFAAGAIPGNALASRHARASANAYCEQKYKSFDPESGTYLGNDGQRHPCP